MVYLYIYKSKINHSCKVNIYHPYPLIFGGGTLRNYLVASFTLKGYIPFPWIRHGRWLRFREGLLQAEMPTDQAV